ncbi:Gmad2 immunoglobulin-like domain-containing protein [Brevibacillus humidisoli]|uniref:Gmad2 immunoglobulin-like domain-containing protein n=1 Tax=Brevibacillus humidisoli TaxID=2895522 RepID=UPI001E38E44B|nr:Gmad2 immunoglobulin-like domain-containing protein [Brevibacillus humidisoli]UFJ39700.1 Gmad2 immunoglobulin-like domain-containing protein [Brevibacillus humidisoli]
MRKPIILIMSACLLLAQGCSSSEPSSSPNPTPTETPGDVVGDHADQSGSPSDQEDTSQQQDTEAAPSTDQAEESGEGSSGQEDDKQAGESETYQNESFQGVVVTKGSDDSYTVTGKARVFEGVVDYVVEDGHNELLKGHVQADHGAPEWGEFEITFQVKKAEPNTTLVLYLFETSAKDGSHRNQLPIPLP